MPIIPKHVDLNLLRLLQALYATRSVSEAGHRLGLSQPAASNALARLRNAMGDPLFVRTRAGMAPTAFAEEIAPAIGEHIDGIAAVLNRRQGFDPETSNRIFRLSLSGLGEVQFLPRLAARVSRAAPRARIYNVAAPLAGLAGALERREADVAIGIVDIRQRGIRSRTLFQDTFEIVARPGFTVSGAAPEDIGDLRIILSAPSATYAAGIEESLARQNLAENVAVRLGHFGALGQLLQELDAVAIVPGQYAETLDKQGVAESLPIRLPMAPLDVNMVWHDKTTHDPACQWLRSQISDLYGVAEACAPYS